MQTPVTNSEAGSAKNNAAFATSFASHNRPMGIVDKNGFLFSSLSSVPIKVVSNGVSAIAGFIELALQPVTW